MADIVVSPLEVLQAALDALKEAFEGWTTAIAATVYSLGSRLDKIEETIEGAVLDAVALTETIQTWVTSKLDLAVSDLKTLITEARTYAKDQAAQALTDAKNAASKLTDAVKSELLEQLDKVQIVLEATISEVKTVADNAIARVSKLEDTLLDPDKYIELLAASLSEVW